MRRQPRRSVLAPAGAGVVTAAAAAALLAAWRFAFVYRRRAGFPARRPPLESPATYGLAFEDVAIASPAGPLPGWFIPAPAPTLEPATAAEGAGTATGAPAVVLVHGWESNRARMLPNARFLHAAGFHTLMFDVRGHGENPPETLPITAAEFGADAAAAARLAAARPDVRSVGIFGHSMGAAGAALAAATEQRIGAVVLTSTPADPYTLTRRTFELAGLRIPPQIAGPLARLTLRVFLRPRRHSVADVSASSAVRRIAAPILLIHGRRDEVVPVANLPALAAVADARPSGSVTETPGCRMKRAVTRKAATANTMPLKSAAGSISRQTRWTRGRNWRCRIGSGVGAGAEFFTPSSP